MTLEAPEISSRYRGPGQFLHIQLNEDWLHPIRRPMSIASVRGNEIDIIYKTFGQVTNQLTLLNQGNQLNIMGPLGNCFTRRENGPAVLVGGGVGLAPILNLYESCKKSILIIGAGSASEHFLDHHPEQNIYLTTDDGSLGIHGNVLDALNGLSLEPRTVIYACGPEAMLKAIQRFTFKNKFKAQLSVESYMGCGTGLCQGCVITRKHQSVRQHSYHETYSLVCREGPVYEGDEVTFG